MDALVIFAGMGLATFFTRFALIAALGRELPPLVRRWLRYVPPAVLAALIVPAVFAPQGRLEIGLSALAVMAGAVVAWRTRNVFWTILGGMLTFWAVRAVGL